ncbi:MAG TPA: serine hydrolase [Hyphomonadaceae bacterium]|nr:serine hydrolase [Hyphomonadaceae bacterium]
MLRFGLGFIALSAVVLTPAAPAAAQKPAGKEKVASILTWTPKQQLERYPAIEKVYQVATIKKGAKVYALPAGQPIDPKIVIKGKTQDFDAFMKQWRISGVIVVKDGKVVFEKYGMGRTPDQRWTSFSVAKSVTSTLIGAAVKDGYIRSIYDPVTRYIPELEGSAYDGVSLRQVMTMTSGVKWSEDYADPNSDVSLSGTQPYNGKVNPLIEYMSKLKRDVPAGTKFVYNTGETDLAGIALSRALAGKSIADYASEKIWIPFGMEQDGLWMVDKAGHERGGCCMSMTLRDYARIGLFMLGGGKADGKDVLPRGWVEEATTNQAPRGSQGRYGFFWWPVDPPNYQARGIFGQGIAIYPNEKLVIAMNSAMVKATDPKQSEATLAMLAAIRGALNATD